MKNTKGITLIALVITIIIMMILFGVVVTVAIKGSLFNKSREGAEQYTAETIRENLTPIVTNMFIEDGNIFYKENSEIENEINRQLGNEDEKAEVVYKFSGNVYVIYRGYICKIDQKTAEIVEVIKVNALYTGDGTDLDGLTIEQVNEMAKTVDYKIKTLDINGGYNVVYTSDNETKNSGSGEETWDVNEIKLATEAYCANNVVIYDGTNPYIPVMVRFYRQNKNTLSRDRGLKYFKVNTNNVAKFSTNNENNDWEFVTDEQYNYEATSNRRCASSETSSSSFNDRTSGHYYASGRLIYTEKPTEILTDLGKFNVTSIDQDDNSKSFSVGNNYMIDVTRYYDVLKEGQKLINEHENNTRIATEFYELAKAILKATMTNYSYDNPEGFAMQIEDQTNNIQDAINKFNESLDSLPQISDEVLAIVKLAKESDVKIQTQEVNGGYNIVYTSDAETKNSGSGEQTWEVGSVKLAAEIYCADNIMVYDGTNPYIPIMVRFYRKNEHASTRSRGLRYFKIDDLDNKTFSTNNENNEWEFVTDEQYNYEATSNRRCRSQKEGTTEFNDKITGHYYASGRLEYNITPEQILTNVGGFTATCCDQDGNTKSFSTGTNYIINVKGYYEKIDDAKELLTIDNLYHDVESTYDLAELINELKNKKYNYTNAEEFANQIQDNIDRLDIAMQKLK